MSNKNCRTCRWAYCRVEKTKHYNYEACALGILPMQPYLDGLCGLYERAADEAIVERINDRPEIVFGEDMEGI